MLGLCYVNVLKMCTEKMLCIMVIKYLLQSHFHRGYSLWLAFSYLCKNNQEVHVCSVMMVTFNYSPVSFIFVIYYIVLSFV